MTLPLPLRLSEFGPGQSVEDFVIQVWGGSLDANHWGGPELVANLEGYLKAGKLFILFDALNEMPKEGYKERAQALRRFIDRWSLKGNRFLVTCRVLDYEGELSGLQRIEVQPLKDDQIKEFLQKELPADWPDAISPDQILTLATGANIIEMPVDRSSVRFYHQSLQEYFVARYIRDLV